MADPDNADPETIDSDKLRKTELDLESEQRVVCLKRSRWLKLMMNVRLLFGRAKNRQS